MTPEQAQQLQQRIVAEQPNLFVRACPGAGKTRLVVDRFLRVARGGGRLAVLAFTNKAANEIADRSSHHGDPRLVGFPNFVGTFDRFVASFIVRPFGQLGGPIQIVDSWDSLDAVVRARGIQGEISLDRFEISPDGVLRFDPRIDASSLDAQTRVRAENIAAQKRAELTNKGYLTCDDAKTYALRLIRDHEVIGRLLRGRFAEIVVDEAQDCSTTELLILEKLHDVGVPLVVVADLNQAIYEWRGTDRNQLEQLAQRLVTRTLTGNWRSSQEICALAATVRGGSADHAVNDPNDDGDPIHLLSYPNWPDPAIGKRFASLVDSSEISRNEAVVLAHRADTAARVVGAGTKPTSARLADFARASHRLQDRGLTSIERQREVAVIQRLLLPFVGAETEEWTTRDAIARSGVDETWLRSTVMELVNTMASLDLDADCDHWTDALRASLGRAGSPRGLNAKSPNVFLRTPTSSKGQSIAWLIGATRGVGIRHSTIHAAKGTEADAVLTVIARDRGKDTRTAQLIQAWKNGTDCEPRRVLYVAITRARRLAAVAIPQAHLEAVQAILGQNDVTFEVHEL